MDDADEPVAEHHGQIDTARRKSTYRSRVLGVAFASASRLRIGSVVRHAPRPVNDRRPAVRSGSHAEHEDADVVGRLASGVGDRLTDPFDGLLRGESGARTDERTQPALAERRGVPWVE